MAKKSSLDIHNYYLERLIYRLDEIGERRHYIDWISPNDIWMPSGDINGEKFCDIILLYQPNDEYPKLVNGYGVPIELKGNKKHRKEAIEQIRMGKEFLEKRLRFPVPYGKFVTYNGSNKNGCSDNGETSKKNGKTFSFELIRFDYEDTVSGPPIWGIPGKR